MELMVDEGSDFPGDNPCNLVLRGQRWISGK